MREQYGDLSKSKQAHYFTLNNATAITWAESKLTQRSAHDTQASLVLFATEAATYCYRGKKLPSIK